MERLAGDEAAMRRGLQYDSSAGNAQLRESIAEWAYRKWPAARVSADRMILTAGSNQFLHLLADALFNPGDIVLAAAPTYFVYMGTLRAGGVNVVGVEADEAGMSIEALKSQLEHIEEAGHAGRVKAIYLVTEFDNPSGSSLSGTRRTELLDLVRRWNERHDRLLVISDAAYAELRYDGDDLPPLLAADDTDDFVIEAGTFSKSFSPGIRIGWGIVPGELVDPLLALKSGIDFGSPHFSQMLMDQVIRSGDLDRHLPTILDSYRGKRDCMLASLENHMAGIDGVHWRRPDGGLYVWLEIPEHVDASEGSDFYRRATEAGVSYVPGHHCFPQGDAGGKSPPVKCNSMRLSFGVQDASGIDTGISRLAEALEASV
ncbi:MAG: PLP-dependent aminotransferase family protein [Aureliella sp.]